MSFTPQPFRIDFDSATLDDLQRRLAATRWPNGFDRDTWDFGTDPAYLRSLVEHWQHGFDWRAVESRLNRFAQFRAEVDGLGLHFVHERAKSSANGKPLVLLLVHGWPDSFVRFEKLIPLLVDPAAHGGDAGDAFDVVVPSLPGYGFSDAPRRPGVLYEMARYLGALMEGLGYERYGVHGGDWGGTITERIAHAHPRQVVGAHMTDVSFMHLFEQHPDLSAAEQRFIDKSQQWQKAEGAYSMIQGTKPQSLAYGLADSPVGLAGWIVEKYRSWSDCDGDVERRFTKDDLLTQATIYWATNTIRSSTQLYHDAMNPGVVTGVAEQLRRLTGKPSVPAGFALFPKDIRPPPRAWGERFFDVQRWTEMPRGGHFAAFEEPELLADELRAFFRPLR